MKIAVVGSGISGLVAATILRDAHDVTLFESAPVVGGHTHTIDVELAGQRYAVDTGFIVYNERTYPNFCRLLEAHRVESQPTDMSFSVRCERRGLEWASRSLRSVFAQPINALRPSFHRMLRDLLRFNRDAQRLIELDEEKLTLRDFATARAYSREFLDLYLVPLGASIWSATRERILLFPAVHFARFLANHGLLQTGAGLSWRVVRGGSRRYVDALLRGFRHRVRVDSPVERLWREPDGVRLQCRGERLAFDRAVIATHSDQALRLLADASPVERAVLGAIRYQPNDAVVHTDARLLPRSRRAWASWNATVSEDPDEPVTITYDMNRLQGFESPEPVLVSLDPRERVAPERVLRRITWHHPIFTPEAMAAQRLHAEIDGQGGVHFCGAYWGNGFHEDGVNSALAACRRIRETAAR